MSSLQYHSPLKDLIGANMKCKVIFLFRNSHLRITLQPGPVLSFTIDGKQVFDLPVSEVSNAVMQPTNKNEVALEFQQDNIEDEVRIYT